MAPDQLKEMEKKGWGDEANGATITVDELITLSQPKRYPDRLRGQQNKTTGRYVQLYEVHGQLPESYLFADGASDEYVGQMQIVGFYYDERNNKQGVTLWAGEEDIKDVFKIIVRDGLYGRALGFGGAEELFEPQVWVNHNEILKLSMLKAASKVIHKTTDANFANRNNLFDAENGEIFVTKEGTDIAQIDTTPRSLALFDKSTDDWFEQARLMASAGEAILGEQPPAGTPFASIQFQAAESQSLHEYRKGKIATFTDEIYLDWIVPQLAKEIIQEQEFLAELDVDELRDISERVAKSKTNDFIKKKILDGELVEQDEVDAIRELEQETFLEGGNKKFIKILKGELKNAPISVKVNIAGKQKNAPAITDKLVNVFRTIVQAPQILDDPRMAKLFNQILEQSGLSPIEFGLTKRVQPAQISSEVEKTLPALARPKKQPQVV